MPKPCKTGDRFGNRTARPDNRCRRSTGEYRPDGSAFPELLQERPGAAEIFRAENHHSTSSGRVKNGASFRRRHSVGRQVDTVARSRSPTMDQCRQQPRIVQQTIIHARQRLQG